MFIPVKTITVITFLLLFFSCKTSKVNHLPEVSVAEKKDKNEMVKKPENWEVNKVYTLKFKDKLFNSEKGIGITFQNLKNESRCPKGVTCFHAGSVEIELLIEKGQEVKEISLVKEGSENTEEAVYSQDQFKVKLLEVKPYPVANKLTDPEKYSIDIIFLPE